MSSKENRIISPIDLNIPIAMIAIAVTMMGIIMPMMNRQDDKIDRSLQGIREEMRDFHDRLIEIEKNRK